MDEHQKQIKILENQKKEVQEIMNDLVRMGVTVDPQMQATFNRVNSNIAKLKEPQLPQAQEEKSSSCVIL